MALVPRRCERSPLAGAHVVLAAPQSELPVLKELAADVERFGVRALVVPTDVAIRADIDRLVKSTLETFGRIDILANIAGIGSPPALWDTTDEELRKVIEVNLLGCARTIHAVMPVMKRQRRGAIVNIGSVAGESGVLGIYSASKFGLRGLNDTVRREVRSWNIEVSLIEPGFVRSNINASMGENLPSPDIVARAIVRAVTPAAPPHHRARDLGARRSHSTSSSPASRTSSSGTRASSSG